MSATAVQNESGRSSPASWGAHTRATLTLGLPLVGSQLGGMAMNTTDTVMLGWYGVTELAAASIATGFLFSVMMFGAGFSFAVVPLASSAEGVGDTRQVRRSIRMGIWIAGIFCFCMMPVLWFTEPIFLALGQDVEVAALSGVYMRLAQWSLFPLLLWWTLRSFLTAVQSTRVVFVATLVGVFLNGFLNYALIFGNWGAPEMGIRGAALATLATNLLIFGWLVAFIALSKRTRHYEVFVRFWRPDWQAFGEVFRIGLPISFTITAETGMFIFAAIFMGWLGVVPLAAHGVVLQLASLAFMVPMGMTQAGTSRVGLFHGRSDQPNLMRSAITILALCLGFAGFSALLFLLWPEGLIRLFLREGDPDALQVLAYGVPLLFVAACFQFADGAQAVAAGLLRGLKDTRIPMMMAIFSYWPVGLFLSWFLAFPMGWGGVGVWTGLAVGLGVAAVILNWRFFKVRPNM